MKLDIRIPKQRKCFATFDSHTGAVDMSFSYRGISIEIEFNEQQWRDFAATVRDIKFIAKHHGLC